VPAPSDSTQEEIAEVADRNKRLRPSQGPSQSAPSFFTDGTQGGTQGDDTGEQLTRTDLGAAVTSCWHLPMSILCQLHGMIFVVQTFGSF